MIQHEQRYLDYIQRRGVGAKDQVASSPDSYVSYLNSVSRLLASDISPELLHSEADVERVVGQLQGERAPNTLRNYASAMRQYVAMVIDSGLWKGTDTFASLTERTKCGDACSSHPGEPAVSLTAQAEAPPIREDSAGAVRVGDSRVLLELVIRAFQDGATPETIVQRYSTLALPDVYAVITYYLRHRSEVEEYLARREQKAEEVRQRLENQQGDLSEIRVRLLAQRQR
jgi:uncharacterized protein (DUF433 family)